MVNITFIGEISRYKNKISYKSVSVDGTLYKISDTVQLNSGGDGINWYGILEKIYTELLSPNDFQLLIKIRWFYSLLDLEEETDYPVGPHSKTELFYSLHLDCNPVESLLGIKKINFIRYGAEPPANSLFVRCIYDDENKIFYKIQKKSLDLPEVKNNQEIYTALLLLLNYSRQRDENYEGDLDEDLQQLYLKKAVIEWENKWIKWWKRAVSEQKLGVFYFKQKNFRNAKNCYKRAIKLDSQNIDNYYNLGLTFTALNEYEKAIKYFTLGFKYYSPESHHDIYIHYNCGRTLTMMKRYNEAIPHFQAGIKSDPMYVYNYIALGNSYIALHRYEDSIEILKRSIEMNPDILTSYNQIANCYVKLGLVEEGIKYIKKEIEIAPHRTAAYYNLAEIFYHNRKYKEAIDQHERASQLLSYNKTNTLVHSCSAFPLIKLKEYKKAKNEILSCFSNPENSFDLFCYGLVLYKLKEYQYSSFNLLDSIVAAPVDNFDREYLSKTKYYYAMTLIKLKENNCDKIIESFNDSILAEPNWSKPHYRIAQFLSLKYSIEKKEEIKSNYLFAVEKNNLMHPCDRLSDLKIIKILETVSLL